MSDIDILEAVLDKTASLLDGVSPEQHSGPTPCTEYDVRTLVNHITGWVQVFAEGANGSTFEGDPTAHVAGDDPGAEFRRSAARFVEGWRTHGVDREVALMGGGKMPGQPVLNMTIMEYLTHGWDLATATRQSVPFTEDEAAVGLDRAQATLPPQYRGEGQSFGHVVEVAPSAPAIERFVGFMGRDPAASE